MKKVIGIVSEGPTDHRCNRHPDGWGCDPERKEAHCLCKSTACEDKRKVFPLYCEKVKDEKCPVELPCESHENGIKGRVE